MSTRGEFAYVYAKMCGILAKSYVGKNVHTITRFSSITELFHHMLPKGDINLPEKRLVSELQRRFVERQIADCTRILRSFRTPDPLLVHYMRSFEVLNVKTIVTALHDGAQTLPALSDIGPYGTIHPEAYPKPAVFAGTAYAWIPDALASRSVQSIEAQLDDGYYSTLWSLVNRLPQPARKAVRELVGREIIYHNIVWALRLRTYYGLDQEGIEPLLIHADPSLLEPALAQFAFPLDAYQPWGDWKYSALVSPDTTDGGHWQVDPRDVENRASRILYRQTLRQFHALPFTLNTSVCFFKMKEFEAGIVRSVVEGMQLSMGEEEILDFLGEA